MHPPTRIVAIPVLLLFIPFVLGAPYGAALADEPNPPRVTFAAIGDYGTGSADEARVAALAASWSPDFILTLGDNNYPSGGADTIDAHIGAFYGSFIAPYPGIHGPGADTNRFFPSLGNHDWATAGAGPYLGYFTLPGNERYYDVRRGPVHLFALDSDPAEPDGVTADSVQAVWLRDALAASTACWRVVYFHHPPYSSGPHGSTRWMQWPFAAWGADLVLSGHDHDYERVERDIPYLVNGLGGKDRYRFGRPVEGSAARYNAGPGALRLSADCSRLTAEFVAVDGTVVDARDLVVEAAALPTPATPARLVAPFVSH